MNDRLYFLMWLFICGGNCDAQLEKKSVTLFEVIQIAKNQSLSSKVAQTRKEIEQNQYFQFRSELKPQISLYGSAPVYTKQFTAVTQPDGTVLFLPITQNIMNAGLGLSQKIPFTGGDLSINTDLSRFDEFRSGYKQYNGTPVYVVLNQPIFTTNRIKWQKKIEPLKLEESKKTYIQNIEKISQQTTKFFFDVLYAQNSIESAKINMTNSEINYATEKRRIDLGTTNEDKLLQLEIQYLKNKQEAEKANYDFQIALLTLRSFTGIRDEVDWVLQMPDKIPNFNIDINQAIEYARKYRPEFTAFERKRLEAKLDLALAKAEQHPVNLVASYGLNKAGDNIKSIYENPKNQQTLSVGFNLPLIDWGRRKSRFNTAKASEKLTIFNNDMDEVNFIQEITTLIKNLDLLKNNILTAQKMDSVTQKRFILANKLYQSGKISVTDLNLSYSEKDNARQSYIIGLRSFWENYFELRALTLFDFEKQSPLYLGK